MFINESKLRNPILAIRARGRRAVANMLTPRETRRVCFLYSKDSKLIFLWWFVNMEYGIQGIPRILMCGFWTFWNVKGNVHQHSPFYLSDQQSLRGPKVLSMWKCFEKDEKVRNRLVQLFMIRRSPKLLVSVIVSNPFCFFPRRDQCATSKATEWLRPNIRRHRCWSNRQVLMASCCVKSRKNSTKAVRQQHCFS